MESLIPLSHKEFLKIDKDYNSAAKAAHLIYVNDKSPGINRIKRGNRFTYVYDDKPLKDKAELDRIKSLAIRRPGRMYGSALKRTDIYRPPVWICATASNTATIHCGAVCETRQNFTICMNSVSCCLLCD